MSTQTELLREAVRLLGSSIDDYDNITEGEFSGTSYYEPRMRFSQEARAFLAKFDAAKGDVPEGFTLVENRAHTRTYERRPVQTDPERIEAMTTMMPADQAMKPTPR